MRGFSSSGRLRETEEGTGGKLVCLRQGREVSAIVSSLAALSLSLSEQSHLSGFWLDCLQTLPRDRA